MPRLADLLDRLPKSKETRMSAVGHVLWICWQTDLDSAVTQTLQNYGGMLIVSDRNQSLWFFFTTDVFLALARLAVWAKFNELNVTIEHFPAKLRLGVKREASLEIDILLTQQEILPGQGLEIWIHPKLREGDYNIPGITFEKKNAKQGMTLIAWSGLDVDVRLPYTSSQGWYAILKPLGNPLDKNFQTGWRFMFSEIENILREEKFKFLVQDNFVMVSVENLRLLRTWLRAMLSRCAAVKEEQHDKYWPCVSVVVDRKGLNFNYELRKKVALSWDNLMPDFPYMSYRNAYLLGEGFAIQDLRFSSDQSSMDSWCNVMLDEGAATQHAIPLLMSGHLISGQGNGCFFCGMRSHETAQCPTLGMAPTSSDVWWELAGMSLETINDSFRLIEHVLTEKGLAGYGELLAKKDDPAALLLRGIFEINAATQLRSVGRRWLNRGRGEDKNLPLEEQRDDSPVWELLDSMCKAAPSELPALEGSLLAAAKRNTRDPRFRTLQAFMAICKGDGAKASPLLKEAAALTSVPVLQAWNEYLQARLAESQGHYGEAIDQYAAVLRVMPQWRDLEYRQIVCKVKMGFAEQILGQVHRLVQDDPYYFNRCLIDPELGRGQLLILTYLQPLWAEAEKNADDEKARVERLTHEVENWFPGDHPIARRLNKDLAEVQRLAGIKNYVAFLQVVKRLPQLEKEISENIQREVEELQGRYKGYLTALQDIRDEASWFPFPKVLREFSREFNECAGIINWAFASNFSEVETFQRALASTSNVDTLLHNLKKRLKFLRMVRDATLFVLTMGKTFFWIELIGLLLCFLGVPAIILYGDQMKLGWLKNMLGAQQWEIQKVLVGIVSVMALGISALRTTIVFEKKRDRLLEEARLQRERLQNARLERIKKQRAAEAAALAKERKIEEERKAKRRFLDASIQ